MLDFIAVFFLTKDEALKGTRFIGNDCEAAETRLIKGEMFSFILSFSHLLQRMKMELS